MRFIIRLALMTMLALFLDSRLALLQVPMNFTALVAYYAGMRSGETTGIAAGMIIGLVEDSLSSPFLGPNMLGKGIVGYAAALITSGNLLRWTPLLGVVGVSFLTLVDNSVVFISRSIFSVMPATIGRAVFIAVMQSLINAPAGMVIRPRHVE